MDGRIFWFLVNLALGNFFVTISPLSILAYTIVSTRLDIACTKIKIQVSVCWNLYKDSTLHGKRTRPFHYITVWHGRLNNTYQNSCSTDIFFTTTSVWSWEGHVTYWVQENEIICDHFMHEVLVLQVIGTARDVSTNWLGQ
jgi:hypothetical protein